MCDTPLTKVDKFCSLGVYLQNKLSWTPHIDYITHKSNHLLGLLKRNLKNSPRIYAYKQLVLPSIEYCCSI